MQKFEGQLTVLTGQEVSIDVVLHVATAATTVEVRDVTPLLQSDSVALTKTLERQRIEQLPILGRGHQNLLQTVPGLVYSNHGHQTGGRPLAYGRHVLTIVGVAPDLRSNADLAGFALWLPYTSGDRTTV